MLCRVYEHDRRWWLHESMVKWHLRDIWWGLALFTAGGSSSQLVAEQRPQHTSGFPQPGSARRAARRRIRSSSLSSGNSRGSTISGRFGNEPFRGLFMSVRSLSSNVEVRYTLPSTCWISGQVDSAISSEDVDEGAAGGRRKGEPCWPWLALGDARSKLKLQPRSLWP